MDQALEADLTPAAKFDEESLIATQALLPLIEPANKEIAIRWVIAVTKKKKHLPKLHKRPFYQQSYTQLNIKK